jgi:hypothetical protein
LQEVLFAIRPGERVTVAGLVADTGILPQTLQTILEALTRAELFEHANGVFTRRRLSRAAII